MIRSRKPATTPASPEIALGFALSDCCSVRWQVSVEKGKLGLRLCLHHWLKHALALIANGWSIDVDRSDELLLRDKN